MDHIDEIRLACVMLLTVVVAVVFAMACDNRARTEMSWARLDAIEAAIVQDVDDG